MKKEPPFAKLSEAEVAELAERMTRNIELQGWACAWSAVVNDWVLVYIDRPPPAELPKGSAPEPRPVAFTADEMADLPELEFIALYEHRKAERDGRLPH